MKTRKFEEPNGLHKSLRFLIILAQFFGFFPVQGICGKSVRSLKFSWWSVGVLFAVTTWLGGWFNCVAHIKFMASHEYDQYEIYEMNGVVFNFSNGTYCLLFIILAKNWPRLMYEWHKVERSMTNYSWPKNLDLRLKLTTVIFMLLEACEHLTVQMNKAIVAFQCKGTFARSTEHLFKNMSFPHIFSMTEYSTTKGIVLQIINTRLAFCWTYVDLFIILICCCIASRFQQITQRVRHLRAQNVTSIYEWRTVREDYNKLCQVCLHTDEKLAYFLVLSFITNFYFIIFHLYRSLNVQESTLETVYFALSFGLLILRTVSVCWHGGWVYEETKAPLGYLTEALATTNNVEIERFVDKIRYETVCITGMRFFNVSKGSILKIANAIVTYELVVIQVNGRSDQKKTSQYSLCK